MDEKLLFVQFPHPGGEHGKDLQGWKCWNRGEHKRKFLRRPGKHVGSGRAQEILFWGEWEPESTVQRIANPVPHGPNFIHEPCYVVPESYEGLQNTDPFVFCKEFLYGMCKQPTFCQLGRLAPGSVILFGSCKDNGFALDTVFVVGTRPPVDHSSAKELEGWVCKEYFEVTVNPWYRNFGKGKACAAASPQKCRLYFGACPDNKVHGMYSFFPCCRYEENSRGFARPKIDLEIDGKQVVNPNKSAGVKFTRLGLDGMKSLWDKVVEKVKNEHLEIGVYAETPERCSHSPCSGRR
jgi:hypothetical protein